MMKNCSRIYLVLMLVACSVPGPAIAQSMKPSQALRQISEQEKKLLSSFDADLQQQKAQPYEWESRTESLKEFAKQRCAKFKIADWKGEELYNLATLYQLAELFPQAAEAYRAYLATVPEGKREPNAVPSLIRGLIETSQLADAEKMLEGLNGMVGRNPMFLLSRISLHRDLAEAYRDQGNDEKAALQARNGYLLADSLKLSQYFIGSMMEKVSQDQIALAAIAIASFERARKKISASDLMKLVERFDFKNDPSLKARFGSELASARLIGSPAPALAVSRWLEGAGRNIQELRGTVILLDFWALWCSPCIAAYPQWREFQSKYGSRGFEVLGATRFYGRSDMEENLSRDEELKSLENYQVKYKVTWPVAIGKMDDLTNEDHYGINAMPTVILIDRRGIVRHVKHGTGGYQKLAKQIERLLSEKT